MKSHKTPKREEFGDFQTPPDLARQVCDVAARGGFAPHSVVEPTCGVGNLLDAALRAFPRAARFLGVEINPRYAEIARKQSVAQAGGREVVVLTADFFQMDWASTLAALPEPWLIVGNPPWVTNAAVGALDGDNLPAKANIDGLSGLAAMTGKSNFDVSESMLRQLFEAAAGRDAIIAMLCKTSVARKVLAHVWRESPSFKATMHRIDAKRHFAAAVDACLLICEFHAQQGNTPPREVWADEYSDLGATRHLRRFGLRQGRLVADLDKYDQHESLQGGSHRWRSGIKHDCGKVMEFSKVGENFMNGHQELVRLESEHLFPLLKCSDLTNGGEALQPRRWLLVTHRSMRDDPTLLRDCAPYAWNYLQRHAAALARRKSSIYRGRAPFTVFGVGDYTFAPYKVAISGLHKQLAFVVVRPCDDKPVVLDDTSYFLSFDNESQAMAVADLLNSHVAREFYEAFIFWDAKRPVTSEILGQLDIGRLARRLGREASLAPVLVESRSRATAERNQLQLF